MNLHSGTGNPLQGVFALMERAVPPGPDVADGLRCRVTEATASIVNACMVMPSADPGQHGVSIREKSRAGLGTERADARVAESRSLSGPERGQYQRDTHEANTDHREVIEQKTRARCSYDAPVTVRCMPVRRSARRCREWNQAVVRDAPSHGCALCPWSAECQGRRADQR